MLTVRFASAQGRKVVGDENLGCNIDSLLALRVRVGSHTSSTDCQLSPIHPRRT